MKPVRMTLDRTYADSIGRCHFERVDATTEAEIAAQQRQDEAEMGTRLERLKHSLKCWIKYPKRH